LLERFGASLKLGCFRLDILSDALQLRKRELTR
jgi:hypothetical protein